MNQTNELKKKVMGLLIILLCMFSIEVVAQQVTISGKVSDTTGGSLPGVTIRVKGTTKGTITDYDGNYTLTTQGNEILQFSFVGLQTKEVSVAGKSTIDIVLEKENIDLDQVVVTGYQTQRKADLTGAISVAEINEIEDLPPGNIMKNLQEGYLVFQYQPMETRAPLQQLG